MPGRAKELVVAQIAGFKLEMVSERVVAKVDTHTEDTIYTMAMTEKL